MHARQPPEPRFERERGGSARALVAAFFGVFIVVGIALALYWQRDRLRSVLVRNPATQAQREAAPSRPKISDRVGQAGQQGPSTNAPGSKEGEPAAAICEASTVEMGLSDWKSRREISEPVTTTSATCGVPAGGAGGGEAMGSP